jgi:hypothetical protein
MRWDAANPVPKHTPLPGLKQCSKCLIDKSFDAFREAPKGSGKYRAECKECIKAYKQTLRHPIPPYVMPEQQNCTKCGVLKLANEFGQYKSEWTGESRLEPHCKKCYGERKRQEKLANPVGAKISKKIHQQSSC